MQHIVHPVTEQHRRRLELFANAGVRALRAMSHGDDASAMQYARPRRDGRHIDIDLGQLVRLQPVLDGKRMQSEIVLQRVQFFLGGFERSIQTNSELSLAQCTG